MFTQLTTPLLKPLEKSFIKGGMNKIYHCFLRHKPICTETSVTNNHFMTQHTGNNKNLCNLKPIVVPSMSDPFVSSRLFHHCEYQFGKDVWNSHFVGRGEPLYKKVDVLKGRGSIPVYFATV